MSNGAKARVLLVGLTCFALGSLWESCGLQSSSAEPTPPKTDAAPFPMAARLGANIYLQTSAEYRACCLQVYQCAAQRLETLLHDAHPRPAKPTVVMDLDETVFDNSSFETFLYKNKLEYTDPLWAVYEEKHPQDVTLIPGTKGFISKAESLGVTVVFISNRSDLYRKSTESALSRNGISVKDIEGRLFLRAKDGKSDKSARREAVAVGHDVLLYFGDNLRDFSEAFVARKPGKDDGADVYFAAIKQRQSLADDAACHWGVDWFVLPNPVYGEWENFIGPDPMAIMHPTSMEAP